jgi:hypothetical protein
MEALKTLLPRNEEITLPAPALHTLDPILLFIIKPLYELRTPQRHLTIQELLRPFI